MCMNSSNLLPCTLALHPRRKLLQGHGLKRSNRSRNGLGREKKREIERKNLKLYMENQMMIRENEKLRKKALVLHQENQALLSQLQAIPNSI